MIIPFQSRLMHCTIFSFHFSINYIHDFMYDDPLSFAQQIHDYGDLLYSLNDMESSKVGENAADVLAVVVQAAGVVGLLEGFARHAAAHVSVARKDVSMD